MPVKTLVRVCHRWALLALMTVVVSAAFSAEEAAPPIVPAENGAPAVGKLVAVLIDMMAGGEMRGSPLADVENILKGGEFGPAVVGYEKARIACDTLRYWQNSIAGVALKRLVLSRLLVESGPFGQDPKRVIIDSRECRLPTVGFRGLFKPTRVTVERQPQDPAAPLAVRFKAVLFEVGDFFGALRTDKGWEHYAGWAHDIEMIIRADIDPQQQEMGNLRLETLHFHGRPRVGEVAREPAAIMRMKAAFSEERTAKSVVRASETESGAQGMLITLFLDEQGTMQNGKWEAKGDVQMWGGDTLFGTKKLSPASAPVVLPVESRTQP